MTRPLCLEDFAMVDDRTQQAPPQQAPDTDTTLAAYEDGYRNGWEDCAKAEAETHRRIGADLAATLQASTLIYAEARQDVLTCLGPLFEDMAAQLLPRLAAEAVAPAVIAELQAIATTATTASIVMMAAPAALPALERLIADHVTTRIDLRAEPAFADGQVSIRFGAEQRDINLSDAATRMAEAIRGFIAQEVAAPSGLPIRKGTA